MLSWILKRAAQWVLVFFLVTSATFLLSSMIPGDFFATHLLDPSIRPETVAQLRHRYSLDQPIFTQYLRWVADLLHLNLGYSLFYQRPVAPVILDAIVKTLWIGLPAFLIGSLGGIVLLDWTPGFPDRIPRRDCAWDSPWYLSGPGSGPSA